MPCRWVDVGLAGRVRCRRRFGYPGAIDPDERVWLTFTCVSGAGRVVLNGSLLAEHQEPPFEADVSALLRTRNELVIDAEIGSEKSEVWGEVALEVRCTAFLRGVAIRPVGSGVEVTGEVVGVSDRPLELYVLLDRHQAVYEVIAPAEFGRRFRLVAELPEGADQPSIVQVDLVNGATVWYTLTLPLGDVAAAGVAAGDVPAWEGEAPAEPGAAARQEPRSPRRAHDRRV
jgi:hypothetical protein